MTNTAQAPTPAEQAVKAPVSSLPTSKTSPNLSFENTKILLYGAPGIGKTTLAANLNGDATLLLATEPGTGGIEAFVRPVISWEDFRKAGQELAAGDHAYKTLVVDTADELFRMCQEFVMREQGVTHPSDLSYGKGWSLLSDEWRLRTGKLCSLGYGVVFTSHSKDEAVKTRLGEITVTQPSLTGQAGKHLLGFVDYIMYAVAERGEDGEQRVLHTQPSENWVAKSRIALPDPLPLDADALRKALAAAAPKPKAQAQAEQPDAEPEEKAA